MITSHTLPNGLLECQQTFLLPSDGAIKSGTVPNRRLWRDECVRAPASRRVATRRWRSVGTRTRSCRIVSRRRGSRLERIFDCFCQQPTSESSPNGSPGIDVITHTVVTNAAVALRDCNNGEERNEAAVKKLVSVLTSQTLVVFGGRNYLCSVHILYWYSTREPEYSAVSCVNWIS